MICWREKPWCHHSHNAQLPQYCRLSSIILHIEEQPSHFDLIDWLDWLHFYERISLQFLPPPYAQELLLNPSILSKEISVFGQMYAFWSIMDHSLFPCTQFKNFMLVVFKAHPYSIFLFCKGTLDRVVRYNQSNKLKTI